MSTPLTDAINALTTYANETTGASDTDLSSAVATLVAGYGSGGSSDTPFLPSDAELVDTIVETINLSTDTTFDSITPSTASQTIRSAGDTGDIYSSTIDLANYEYCVFMFENVPYVYTSTPSGVSYGICQHIAQVSYMSRFESDYEWNDGTNDARNLYLTTVSPMIRYTKSSGSLGLVNLNNYGTVGDLFKIGVSSGAASPTLNVTSGIVFCRGNATYFSVDALALLDSANTNITRTYKIYRYPRTEGAYYWLQGYDRYN